MGEEVARVHSNMKDVHVGFDICRGGFSGRAGDRRSAAAGVFTFFRHRMPCSSSICCTLVLGLPQLLTIAELGNSQQKVTAKKRTFGSYYATFGSYYYYATFAAS